MNITGIIIDSREPEWVKKLTFEGIPTAVSQLDTGDLWAVDDAGNTLVFERKTPSDFLNSLRDERLLPQLARLVENRQAQAESSVGASTDWPYLVITGGFGIGPNGKVTASGRETGWSWNALQGALMTIQEMGVMVVYTTGESDYEHVILQIGRRERKPLNVLPPRQATMLGAEEALVATLPGIGVDKALKIMEWANGRICDALVGLTDLNIACPVEGIGPITRRKIRHFLGLRENITLEIGAGEKIGDEKLEQYKVEKERV